MAAGSDSKTGGLLLVHAHPDDESIGTGATMARYAAAGHPVTLVTCTLGELGEVIPPELAHLAAGRDGGLGEYRIGELAAACAALGVTDHRFLGGPGRWRDSGMMGLPDNDAPGCFWQADPEAAAQTLAAVIREVRPRVLVSYDAFGGYGHPDHIQAHRVTRRAFELTAADAPVAKLYAAAMPAAALAASLDVGAGPFRPATPADLPAPTPGDQVTTEIDATAWLTAKLAAMTAHATQITVAGDCYALSNGLGRRASGREHYTLLAGPPRPAAAETDLFAGLT